MLLRNVVAYHKCREKKADRYRGLRKTREKRAASGRTKKFRERNKKPPLAIVEQAVVPGLLELSADALRVYCTLCRFANGRTALAYPGTRTLLACLGGVPYHTDFVTGRTRVGLTTAQKATRKLQLGRWTEHLTTLLDELIIGKLISPATVPTGTDARKNCPGFRILRMDGSSRRLKDLKYRHAFFQIPGWLFDVGAFGIWRARPRSHFQPISDKEVRLLLLALRDNDELRYGGINPDKVLHNNDELRINRNAWPVELTYSVTECNAVVARLLQIKLVKTRSGVFSREHAHLIDPVRNKCESSLEILLTTLGIA